MTLRIPLRGWPVVGLAAVVLVAMLAGALTAAQIREATTSRAAEAPAPAGSEAPDDPRPAAATTTEDRAEPGHLDSTDGPAPAAERSAPEHHAVAWPEAGAAPDCGGPESYEPPESWLDPDRDEPLFFTSVPEVEGDGTNGRIPRAGMTALGWCTDSRGNEQWLRNDAARALVALNEAYREEFGENLAIDLSYRSYEAQVEMREHYGTVAAEPGTSNHGWGTAIDLWEWEAHDFGSARYAWLVEHGPSHGWIAPDWAREDGSNPEYWHFEYAG